MQFLRLLQARQVLLTSLLQFFRLDEQEPTVLRKMVCEMAIVGDRRVEHRQVDAFQPGEAPLAGHFETSQRIDFVAEELDADRSNQSGAKMSSNPPRTANSPGSSTAEVQ